MLLITLMEPWGEKSCFSLARDHEGTKKASSKYTSQLTDEFAALTSREQQLHSRFHLPPIAKIIGCGCSQVVVVSEVGASDKVY